MVIWSAVDNYAYYVHLPVANITELLSGQELCHFFDDKLKTFLQLISNEVSGWVPSFLWLHSKVSRLKGLLFWESTNFFNPHRYFPLINSFIGVVHCLSLQGIEVIDLFMCVPNFLFRDYLLSFSWKFKVGPILSFSYIMSSMFIFIFNDSHN